MANYKKYMHGIYTYSEVMDIYRQDNKLSSVVDGKVCMSGKYSNIQILEKLKFDIELILYRLYKKKRTENL